MYWTVEHPSAGPRALEVPAAALGAGGRGVEEEDGGVGGLEEADGAGDGDACEGRVPRHHHRPRRPRPQRGGSDGQANPWGLRSQRTHNGRIGATVASVAQHLDRDRDVHEILEWGEYNWPDTMGPEARRGAWMAAAASGLGSLRNRRTPRRVRPASRSSRGIATAPAAEADPNDRSATARV